MATINGEKYEKSLGNMRMATAAERQQIQAIVDLKQQIKDAQREIVIRTGELPQGEALVCPVSMEGELKYLTVKPFKPSMVHVPIHEIDLSRMPTTKADKKDFEIND